MTRKREAIVRVSLLKPNGIRTVMSAKAATGVTVVKPAIDALLLCWLSYRLLIS